MIALSRYPSASWASDNVEHSDSDGPGFTIRRQARQTDRPNRVHKSYGLVVLLQLLPTPPRDDAVTFRYRPESAYLKRTHTSRIKQTCKRTIVCLRHPTTRWLGHPMDRQQQSNAAAGFRVRRQIHCWASQEYEWYAGAALVIPYVSALVGC